SAFNCHRERLHAGWKWVTKPWMMGEQASNNYNDRDRDDNLHGDDNDGGHHKKLSTKGW
ncbi:hypothetical protein L208DRAFT_1409891, partial [Tricholoma matsutake]